MWEGVQRYRLVIAVRPPGSIVASVGERRIRRAQLRVLPGKPTKILGGASSKDPHAVRRTRNFVACSEIHNGLSPSTLT